MQLFHKNTNKNSIIVFFSGWALDFSPYARLFSNEVMKDFDLLFVWDYRNTDFVFDFSKYDEVRSISFSYGVFMSQFVQLPQLTSNIAVNGTLCPINREFGINPKMFDLTLNNLNEATIEKFYKNMFLDANDYALFAELNKSRNVQEAYAELANIKALAQDACPQRDFTKAIISNSDRIIPTNAQKNFWQGKTSIETIDCGHFPFYKYTPDELFNG